MSDRGEMDPRDSQYTRHERKETTPAEWSAWILLGDTAAKFPRFGLVTEIGERIELAIRLDREAARIEIDQLKAELQATKKAQKEFNALQDRITACQNSDEPQ